ncbi:NADPH-dependent F420 reductase [Streptomyces niveus]|uniref:NADPH-dependent F420 reductase n=1 Tax=Streptomyces niveus TaxID=193462 RepID=UPI00343D8AE3
MSGQTLGIVGSGNIGAAVTRLAVRAGVRVLISNSRGPRSLTSFADELGGGTRPVSIEEAARASELVVVAIPFLRFRDLPPAYFEGQTVVETMNFDPRRDQEVAHLLEAGSTPSELIQAHLADAHIVKAFSNIFAAHLELLARPPGAPDRSALPVVSDNGESKRQAMSLLSALGWDSVDVGSLSDSNLFDLGTPAFCAPYMKDSSGSWWDRLDTDPGVPLPASQLRLKLDSARLPHDRD